MPRRHRAVRPQPYNRVCSTEDTDLIVADRAHKAGKMTWKEVQAIQDQRFDPCPKHGKPMKAIGLCEDCTEEISAIGRAMRGVKS